MFTAPLNRITWSHGAIEMLLLLLYYSHKATWSFTLDNVAVIHTRLHQSFSVTLEWPLSLDDVGHFHQMKSGLLDDIDNSDKLRPIM